MAFNRAGLRPPVGEKMGVHWDRQALETNEYEYPLYGNANMATMTRVRTLDVPKTGFYKAVIAQENRGRWPLATKEPRGRLCAPDQIGRLPLWNPMKSDTTPAARQLSLIHI